MSNYFKFFGLMILVFVGYASAIYVPYKLCGLLHEYFTKAFHIESQYED